MNTLQRILCLILLKTLLIPASAQLLTNDLQADWSTNNNPNGPWTYRAGNRTLPAYIWYAGLTMTQPSWGDFFPLSNPSRLPAWFKSLADPVAGLDWKADDVVVHTQDDLNGAGNGQANVVWTSPLNGYVRVSGGVWMSHDVGRANDWRLYRNGVLLSQGSISSGDPYNRAHPFEFQNGSGGTNALEYIPVLQGDRIMLEIARMSTYGDLVGVQMKVTQVLPAPTMSIACSQVQFCWNTVSNVYYLPQFTTTLNTNEWFTLAPAFFSTSNATYCINDAILAGQPQRMYRVVTTNALPSP